MESEKLFRAAQLMHECSEILNELGELLKRDENNEDLPQNADERIETLFGKYMFKLIQIQKIQL